MWRWRQNQQQSALVSSIEPAPTQIVGYPGAVQMVPAPVAGVTMYDGNMVTTKTYSAGAHAPVPVGYVHTGHPGYDGHLQHPQHPQQQQYQPYGGAFGVPVQQQPPHGAPVQYMHRPDQHQQQSLPQSNAQLPSTIGSTTRAVAPEAKPAFFSPGGANAQQQPPPQQQQPYSHALPGQVAPSNSAVSGASFMSAPPPAASYAFAAPAGSFAPSAPPPAYGADDSGYNSNAQIGQEYAPQPPPPSYL